MTPRQILADIATELERWKRDTAADRDDYHRQRLETMLGEVDPEPTSTGRPVPFTGENTYGTWESDEPDPELADPFGDADRGIRGLLEHDGHTVTGWALVAAVERIDPSETRPGIVPLQQSLDYSVSPACSPALAAGLADALAQRLRRIARTAWIDEE